MFLALLFHLRVFLNLFFGDLKVHNVKNERCVYFLKRTFKSKAKIFILRKHTATELTEDNSGMTDGRDGTEGSKGPERKN